ncbi:MAG: hypothetical protein ACOH1T_11535 [Microbacteriaceae bacterium]
MTSPRPEVPAVTVQPKGYWQSLRFHLLTPWWRGLFFFGAIAWGIGLNVAYFFVEPRQEFLGVVSLIPMFAFIILQQSRARASLREAQAVQVAEAARARKP